MDENCLEEVLIIASALTVQDPRERPMDKQEAADTAHAAFRHEASDFLTYLNLWSVYHQHAAHLSTSKLRKWVPAKFPVVRAAMREWHDIHQQLQAQVKETQFNQAGRGRAASRV